MKKTLLILASAAMLLVGCAKEKLGPDAGTGEMVTANFTAQMQGMPQTKAVTDGEGTKATRCVMEIYYKGVLYTRDVKPISSMKATFTPKLVSNRTYDVLFWADCGGENLADKYYKTNAEGLGLQAVEMMATSYDANDDARDAFFTNESVPVGQQVSSETFTLTRPFSQVNIITTDAAVIKNANLYPDGVKMVYKAPTKFNLLTETLSEEKELTVTGAPYETFGATSAALTLEMDYLFAGIEKSALDIAFEASKAGELTVTSHSFTNIPVQRNYRTNIKGALLTTTGDWTATIAPAWATPAYDVPFLAASTIAEAQDYIAPAAEGTQTVKVVDLSKATISTTDIKGDDKKIEFKLKTTSPVDMVNFALPEIPHDVLEAGCTGWKITYDPGYPTQNVNVTAPEGTSVTIEAPNSHVTLNGELYEQVTATTSQSTLVVPAGVTVKNLIVKEGAVEIHGVVNILTVSPETGKTVVFKDCENLKPAVYAIAKQNIAEGYVADDATNSIVKKDFVQDGNGVWHVMNAKAYNEFAEAVNGGTTFEGQTVVLDADIDFQNATVAPIGNLSDNKPFKGTFNGNNKKLSNVTVQNIVGKQGVGIFGKVYAPCVIKDLTVENATVIGDKTTAGDKAIAYVGGIAGHGYAIIQNCTFKGDIYAGHQMGGIAGSGGFTITGCTFEGNIISERDWGLGGIIGNCQDGGAISGNTAKGTISAKNANYCGFIAGGIIGCAIYTTYDVKDNYAAMSMSYDGVAFENIYPIVGVYNIDGSEEDKSITDFAKLLDHLANNTWDKTISPKDSYSILYNNETPTKTGYVINYGAATTEAIVAKIGETGYTSLEAAFAAAQAGQTIEIIYAGTYTLPSPISNLKIKGTDGVVFNAMKEYGQSVSLLHDVEFESVKFIFGTSHYTGFQHSESVSFTKCTFEGYFNSYGTMLFDQCTFNSPEGNYSMWCYAGDVTYRNCTINCKGKFVNAYNEGNTTADRPWKIVAEGCTFNSSVKNKAAFNIKATCGSKPLYYDVEIKNCTANGDNWPAVSTSESLVVGSALWQVDDINASVASKIKVTVDNTVVYGE